jgi:hypothetical protein
VARCPRDPAHGDEEIEIRPVFEREDVAPDATPGLIEQERRARRPRSVAAPAVAGCREGNLTTARRPS